VFRTDVQNHDVAVIGGGLAGMASALRLQSAGLNTIVLEAHGHAGGCAGYYRRRGFSFDVGATTLVDFEPGGVGARFLDVSAPGDTLSAPAGYRAVMISTHTALEDWHAEDYGQRKKEIGERLVEFARRVYPRLGERAAVFEVGTPRHEMTPPPEIADLLTTTPGQRRIALTRPFAGLALFAATVHMGWWWLTPLLVFAVFVAVVTVTHDVVHRTLGLGPRGTDWALFFMGLVLLESGHAYRLTHLRHHRLFPNPADDPEGYPADMTLRVP
jgi:phytoene dehydrogenase-like protein